MLQIPRQLSRRALTQRAFSTLPRHYLPASPFQHTASPPRLPKEEQEIFERLQKQSTGAFSTPRDSSVADAAPNSAASIGDVRMRINQSPDSENASQSKDGEKIEIPEGDELHPHLRRGAIPEFEGDVNPQTGEVGGPKNEPLRWGARGDWSFNGRVTDF